LDTQQEAKRVQPQTVKNFISISSEVHWRGKLHRNRYKQRPVDQAGCKSANSRFERYRNSSRTGSENQKFCGERKKRGEKQIYIKEEDDTLLSFVCIYGVSVDDGGRKRTGT